MTSPEAAPRTAHRLIADDQLHPCVCGDWHPGWFLLLEGIEAEAAAGTALALGSQEPDGLDVERLAQAVKRVGRWRQHNPGGIAECRPYADLLAAEYARLAAGEESK